MARMIPSTIHSSVKSGAERRMFHLMEVAPRTDDWICLHSLGLARHVTKRRGEADFVVLCQHGIFVLEVKGGAVKRKEGIWTFTNRYGEVFSKAEGPFEQAAGAMFTLEKEIRAACPGSPVASALFGYGVVVPDVRFEEMGCEADRAMVYDLADRARPFDAYINRLAGFTRGQKPGNRRGLKKDQIEELASVLRRDFDLVPSVATVLEDSRHQLAELTKQQFVVLDSLETFPRALVEGVAGSGKTLLALESARRQARRGLSVLLLCYNRNLAARLRDAVSGEEYPGVIEVGTLHGYCRKLIKQSSLEEEFLTRCESEPKQLQFDVLYPEYATLAVFETVTRPFDSIVIDEAQDVLTESVLELIDHSVKGGLESGSWQLYLDSNNQASIYGRLDEDAIQRLRPLARYHVLTVNCRNTKQIALNTVILSGADHQVAALAEGPPVDFLSYQGSDGWMQRLCDVIDDLNEQSVSPESIVVLLPKRPLASMGSKLEELGLVQLSDENVSSIGGGDFGCTAWSPVSGFKGLESDIVVLAGIEDIENDWWRAVTYVGMSRARTRLVVILKSSCEPIRVSRLEAALRREFGEREVGL